MAGGGERVVARVHSTNAKIEPKDMAELRAVSVKEDSRKFERAI